MERTDGQVYKRRMGKLVNELAGINKTIRDSFKTILEEISQLRTLIFQLVYRLQTLLTKKSGKELLEFFEK